MHPNAFLKALWRAELKPQVFVAMSFDRRYSGRFSDIFKPVIEGIEVDGVRLKAKRVDISQSGDSILTEIIDGVAHSQLVLADVSTVGKDSDTSRGYRNGNVMYEVGLALACRQPGEVLLVRDDNEKFLFDISTIPHKTIDFTKTEAARKEIREFLIARLGERDFIDDARLKMVTDSLHPDEITTCKTFAEFSPGTVWFLNRYSLPARMAIYGLLQKGMLRFAELDGEGNPGYEWTQFGFRLAQEVDSMGTTLVDTENEEQL